MTMMEKYNELLMEVGALFKQKNDTIALMGWQIKSLEDKVRELESGSACAKCADCPKGKECG